MDQPNIATSRMTVVFELPDGHPLRPPSNPPTRLSDHDWRALELGEGDGFIITPGERSLVEAPELVALGPELHAAFLLRIARNYLQVHREVLAGTVQREVITITGYGKQALKLRRMRLAQQSH